MSIPEGRPVTRRNCSVLPFTRSKQFQQLMSKKKQQNVQISFSSPAADKTTVNKIAIRITETPSTALPDPVQVAELKRVRRKTEALLYGWLCTIKEIDRVQEHVQFAWCISSVTQRQLSFDFVLTCGDLQIIVELDGPHHFRNHLYFGTLVKDEVANDCNKMKLALKQQHHHHPIIRISQEDVLANRMDWKQLLQQTIQFIHTAHITAQDSPIYYIAKDTQLYAAHRKEMSNSSGKRSHSAMENDDDGMNQWNDQLLLQTNENITQELARRFVKIHKTHTTTM